MQRILGVLAASLLLMAAAPATYGGWAVITLEDTPSQLEAGRSTQLVFTVLQHGVEPMRNLRPTVTVTLHGEGPVQTVRAEAGRRPGQYVATITPDTAGTVTIAIDANWHEARITLLPIPVVAANTQAAAASDASRGQQLFVAKGCVTCHAKRDDRAVQARHQVAAGPELTGRTWPADWLAEKLADPARSRVPGAMNAMPNLDLSPAEISALVAYLNGGIAKGVSAAR